MPDGSITQRRELTEFDSECRRMDRRLVKFGQILLQGAKGSEPSVEEPDEPKKKTIWPPDEEASAYALLQRVNLLPARQRFVVLVFYKAREADYWHELMPDKREEVATELCREVNARLRRYAEASGEKRESVGGFVLRDIRDDAIRALVVAEAQQQRPRNLHPCG